jgi:dTDP-4-amino-4,6-dideoxygalactose transaminase
MSNTNKRIFLSPPFVGAAERAAVRGAFDSGYVAPCGPQVDEFERRLAKLAGRRYAVAVSSGTAAIDLLMAELGVDETWTVVAPTLTFIATVGPAFHRGAKLVFVDSDATGNIDVSLLEKALGSLRAKKALVVGVDLYGNCCDYGAIAKLCRKFDAVFVTDAAEAVGAMREGRPAGSAGLAGVYSFNGNKIITTSGGGAIVTDDRGLAERARKRAQQSREKCVWYEHKEVGYN